MMKSDTNDDIGMHEALGAAKINDGPCGVVTQIP